MLTKKQLELIFSAMFISFSIYGQSPYYEWDHAEHPKLNSGWVDSMSVIIMEGNIERKEDIYYYSSGGVREIVYKNSNNKIDSVRINRNFLKVAQDYTIDPKANEELHEILFEDKIEVPELLTIRTFKYVEGYPSQEQRLKYLKDKGVHVVLCNSYFETDYPGSGERIFAISTHREQIDSLTFSYTPFTKQLIQRRHFKFNDFYECLTFEYNEADISRIIQNIQLKDSIQQRIHIFDYSIEEAVSIQIYQQTWDLLKLNDLCHSGQVNEPVKVNDAFIISFDGLIGERTNVLWNGKALKHVLCEKTSERNERLILILEDDSEILMIREY